MEDLTENSTLSDCIKQTVLERDFVKIEREISETYVLFTYEILHPNGDIRNEAFNYFVDLGMRCHFYLNPDEEFEEKYWSITSIIFFHLRWMHDEYEKMNVKSLPKSDHSIKKTIPWSYDTQDSFLNRMDRMTKVSGSTHSIWNCGRERKIVSRQNKSTDLFIRGNYLLLNSWLMKEQNKDTKPVNGTEDVRCGPLEFSFQIFSHSPIKDERDYSKFVYIDFYFDRD